MTDRLPPNSIEAETAVLGSILLDNSIMADCAKLLQPSDFFNDFNRKIFRACLDIWPKNEIDVISIYEVLPQGYLDTMYLSGLTDGVAAPSNYRHYAQLVKDKAVFRKIIYTCQDIAAQGYQSTDLQQYALAANERLKSITGDAGYSEGLERLSEGISGVSDEIIRQQATGGLVKTGFDSIDSRVGGLWGNLLHVVAGRPSMGKSAFALNMALNVAADGKKVSIFSLEDARPYQQRRALASLADCNLSDIILGRVSHELHPAIIEATAKISSLPIWMSDRGQTVDQIRQAAWAQQSTHGLDVLIVDHLGYIADQGKEYQVVSEATRKFAYLAKELQIPVVLLVQLNRGAESEKAKLPQLKDLRGSGRIEEDARSIWFCFRKGYYFPDDPSLDGQFQLIIAKTSHGPTGIANLHCNLAKMQFRDRTGNEY